MYWRKVGIVMTVICVNMMTRGDHLETCSGMASEGRHRIRIWITEFGGVGDGKTINTNAFRDAIYSIQQQQLNSKAESDDGIMLYIPDGVFLTGPFNLTSRITLFLASGAVIRATQDTSNWPLAEPLPSYGRGRERQGGRYTSFILGDGLHDVTITGENGTIDGQGDVWWNMWRQKTLQYTRPHLIEFMHSTHISISNVVLKNSPFWNIHPVYCSNVVVRYVTILAPANSPNTDGVDPDSSSNVCIEDLYISNGDDMVAIKSGWDEYGIAYGRSSSNITIRRVTGSSPFAGIAIGSETSGGVENVLVENINLTQMGVGIHIKTNVGRGGYIRNITVSNVYIQNARKGIKIAGDVGDHPDNKFNPNANPIVTDITLKNIQGEHILQAGLMKGIKNAPFMNICLSDISFYVPKTKRSPWECSDVEGSSLKVNPSPCSELVSTDDNNLCFNQI